MADVVASQVSVRELKTHLSEWLARAQAGEVVEVTSHRKPIARITAVQPAESSSTSPLQKAIDAGLISWSGQKPNLPPPVKLRVEGKLLVDEAQSNQMRQISTKADAIGVCRISWAEIMAALARLQREDPINNEDLELARQQLSQSWKTFTIVEVSQSLVEKAGCFADVFALRGYDSVQLAAAHELHVNTE
jgi:hypothetical protein